MLTNLADDELLRLMASKNEHAFTVLYQRRHGAVYRFALQMSGSPSVAEETTQEVFLILLREASGYDPARGPLASYLYGVARRLVWRRMAQDRTQVQIEEQEEDGRTPEQRSRSAVESDLVRDQGDRCVAQFCCPRIPRGGSLVRFARTELRRSRAGSGMRGGHGPVAVASGARPTSREIGGQEIQLEWVPGMNCTEFESVVVDIARGGLMDSTARREGLAHTTGCERCGRRLANEQALSGLLAVAAAEDVERTAPAAVQQALLSAFREREFAGRAGKRAWWLGAAAAAVAALMVLTFFVMPRKLRAPQIVKAPMVLPAPATEPTKVIAPVYRETRKPPARTLRAAHRKPVTPKPPSAGEGREVVTEFIPVIYDPEPIDQPDGTGPAPRSALAAFGLPMNEQRAEETIQADVVLGEDGLARAVRFVK